MHKQPFGGFRLDDQPSATPTIGNLWQGKKHVANNRGRVAYGWGVDAAIWTSVSKKSLNPLDWKESDRDGILPFGHRGSGVLNFRV